MATPGFEPLCVMLLFGHHVLYTTLEQFRLWYRILINLRTPWVVHITVSWFSHSSFWMIFLFCFVWEPRTLTRITCASSRENTFSGHVMLKPHVPYSAAGTSKITKVVNGENLAIIRSMCMLAGLRRGCSYATSGVFPLCFNLFIYFFFLGGGAGVGVKVR